MPRFACRLSAWILSATMAGGLVARADPAGDYTKSIRPLMKRKCYDCHNAEKQKGDVVLDRFENLDAINAEPELWQTVLEKVQAYEMPPKKAGELSFGEFETFRSFLVKLPKPEKVDCDRIASDRTENFYRGHVMSRRLNRAEYINTIHSSPTGLRLS